MIDYSIRDDMDMNAAREMCVLNPMKLVLTKYPEDQNEFLTAPVHPNRDDLGVRELQFENTLFIEQEDFREEANKKYKRLVLGKRVRLRYAYVIEADEVIKDSSGNIVEVRARIIEGTLGQDPSDGVKPTGVIHRVSASDAVGCEVRLYDRLILEEAPGAHGQDVLENVNPQSLEILQGCLAEKSMANAPVGTTYQFERVGYFCRDCVSENLVFNRTIGLRDIWNRPVVK